MHFLEADDLRAAFPDDLGDPGWVSAPIEADALVNIVRQDGKVLHHGCAWRISAAVAMA
jgi:hypothetical protein